MRSLSKILLSSQDTADLKGKQVLYQYRSSSKFFLFPCDLITHRLHYHFIFFKDAGEFCACWFGLLGRFWIFKSKKKKKLQEARSSFSLLAYGSRLAVEKSTSQYLKVAKTLNKQGTCIIVLGETSIRIQHTPIHFLEKQVKLPPIQNQVTPPQVYLANQLENTASYRIVTTLILEFSLI